MVPANDTRPVDPQEPEAAPESAEEAIERQIASLLSAWDKTSLCARREFLTRIDQRIMTTLWIRSRARPTRQERRRGLIIGAAGRLAINLDP